MRLLPDLRGGFNGRSIIPGVVLITALMARAGLPGCLDGYALYSKAQTVMGDRDSLYSGTIGSNGTVTLGQDAKLMGDVTSHGNILLMDRSTVYGHVTSGGSVTLQSGAQITGNTQQNASVPICNLPQDTFSIGSQDITIYAGVTTDLPPGNYKDVHVYGNGRLKLHSGTYALQSLTTDADGQFEFDPSEGAIEVYTKVNMAFGDRTQFNFTGTASPDKIEFFSRQPSALTVGTDMQFQGTLVAPWAQVHVFSRTTFSGAVYADSLNFEPDVRVHDVPYASLPVVAITSPSNGFLTKQSTIPVAWTINGVSQTSQTTENLTVEGNNEVIRCSDGVCDSITVVRDQTPPVVKITSPANGFYTNQTSVPVAWTVDGVNQTTQTTETLVEGANAITRSATDSAGNTGTAEITVTLDTQPPVVHITSPVDGATLEDGNPIQVEYTVDGQPQAPTPFTLVEGENQIVVTNTDAAGNVGADTIHVTYITNSPTWPTGTQITATDIQASSITLHWPAPPSGHGILHYLVYQGDVLLATLPGNQTDYAATGLLINTHYAFTVAAVDTLNNMSSGGPQGSFTTANQLPPDPATIAPSLPAEQTTSMISEVAFLFQGPNAIQTGVADSAINAVHLAVLRGVVQDKQGNPIPGVTVSLLGHSEFGSTVTRTDGEYDLALNGGGQVTVSFAAQNYLTVERSLHPRWQEFDAVDTVVMVSIDTAVSQISLAPLLPMQVAQGSEVSDSSGVRQATLLFPTNTQATMTLPGGGMQTLSSMHVRATEFTVGPNGQKAMPGNLPPNSAYTYAVEFTVDEAQAASATQVQFSNPVWNYVQNFLNIPVGYDVPSAYFDPHKGQWIPTADGRVIRIAGITNGEADVVVDTDGTIAAAQRLADFGITDEERTKLATLYSPGQTLWRVPVQHFTSYDYNYPPGLPPDAANPNAGDPDHDHSGSCGDGGGQGDDVVSGSDIDCQTQSLGEDVAVPGFPGLHYRSDRVPAPRWNTLQIHVSDASLPASVEFINLHVFVAGRTFTYTFPPQPNIVFPFTWDGMDAYGRHLSGRQPYSYTLDYAYPLAYQTPVYSGSPSCGQSGNLVTPCFSFGLNGLPSITPIQARSIYFMGDSYQGYLGAPEIEDVGRGWTLDSHHSYDPTSGILHLGSGQDRSVQTLLGAIYTVAGVKGTNGYSGDGGPALNAELSNINDMDIGPDGSIYLAERGSDRIRKIDPNGNISTVAQGHEWYTVKAAPDGSLYMGDGGSGVEVWKLSPQGQLSVFAGGGSPDSGYGDGGPATQASLSYPHNVDIGPDGSVYIADLYHNLVRRVTPDGIIHTVAGGGSGYADGLPATSVNISVDWVSVAADGSIYIADAVGGAIRKVNPAGIISTVAGNGTSGTDGDGGPALQAQIVTSRVKVFNTKDGGTRIYFFDELNRTVRFIDENGIVNRLAGGGSDATDDGIPVLAANVSEPRGIAVDPDGNVYLGLFGGQGLVRKIIGQFPAFTDQNLSIPSSDGSEVYLFSPEGRHLKTYNAYTGQELLNFSYDDFGDLTQITDPYGNATSIERDANGAPLALHNAYGQSLRLNTDADGNLTQIALPNNDTHAFTYTDGNLMATYTTPNGQVHTFTYDDEGRLTKDQDPAGGFTTVAKQTMPDQSWVSKLTSALGRIHSYETDFTPDLSKVKVNTDPAGLVTTTETAAAGVVITDNPDSTETRVVLGPNPQLAFQGMVPTVTLTDLPSGLTQRVYENQSATLADPNNFLSLTSFADTNTINGRAFLTRYDNSDREWLATSPEGRSTASIVDQFGKVVERDVPEVDKMNYSYDDRGRLTSMTQGSGGDARVTAFAYDNAGYLAAIQDAENRTFAFTYDGAGRVTQETMPDGRQVNYTYDGDGNVASITPPGKPEHDFTYTPIDLEATYSPPPLGAGLWTTQNGYNLDQQLLDVNRPDNRNIHYNYDTAGRVSSINTPSGDYTFGYNSTTGHLQTLSSPYSETLGYNYDGFLPTSVAWSGTVNGSVSGGYDANFWMTSQTVNGANAVDFSYDNDGLLTQAGDLALSRDAQNGRETGSSVGAVSDQIAYNEFGELSAYEADANGNPVYQCAYGRDKLGRITTDTETVQGVTHVFEYTYDLAGRLQQVKEDGAVTATYSYDSNGNRLTKVDGSGTTNGTYDDQDRLTQYGNATYVYNNNGDLQTKTETGQTTTYNYDVFGNLTEVQLPGGTDIQYVIDGQNRRVGKKVNGVLVQEFLYQNQLNPVAELDGSGNVVAKFVYGSKGNVPDLMIKGGVTYRIISDHLGSPKLVINSATGAVVEQLDYDEFGNVIGDSNPGFQPFGFAGGLYDEDTKLVRFGARDYASDIGRWITKDPAGLNFGMNLYAYVKNNPMNRIDPLGLYECTYYTSTHTMVCISDDGNNNISSRNWTSGNNGSNCITGDCQDNPNHSDESYAGPAPQGHYTLGPPTAPGGGRRRMTPDAGTDMKGRSGIETHGCTNPATCSEGCLAAKSNNTRDNFNNAMSHEEGHNTVTVVP